jgi:hypothetical protein
MGEAIAAHTISARLAHVANDDDLLARSVTRLPQPCAYFATIDPPADRPHDRAMLDAGQQVVRAICHLFEGIPHDHGIAIHHTEIATLAPVKPGTAMEAWVYLTFDRDNPRHFLWQCDSTIDFRQGGVRIATAHIKGMTLPRTVGDPMMRRHHAPPCYIAA